MDYEKAYKNAFQKIREGLQPLPDGAKISGVTRAFLEEVFPELRESKDERIRKWLIKYFNKADFNGMLEYVNGIKSEDILAWLEKQGEQEEPQVYETRDGEIITYSETAGYKVEPKFKVDDWIVNNENGKVSQIKKIVYDESGYGYDHTNGWFHSVFEKDYHLWTIQDAKDGDILACGDKVTDCPFIFHNLTEDLNPRSYCGVNTLCHFQDNDENGGFWCKSDEVRPATKEQRELLFKKMKESGYQWNPDTKELKKVEQKPTWSDEDERMCQETIDWFEKKCFPYALEHENPARESIRWLKSLKERLS